MYVEEAFRALIVSDPVVSGLIGSRLYPIQLPQKPTLPAVVYTVISDPRVYSMKGPSGLSYTRFQLDVYGKTYEGTKAAFEAIDRKIGGFRGMFAGVNINSIVLEDPGPQDGYEDDLAVYSRTADYRVAANYATS